MMRKQNPIVREINQNPNLREYRGYSVNAQQRQKSDEVMRHFLTEQLRENEDSLTQIQENAILVQCIIVWPDLDDLLNRLGKLSLLIENTNYETSTFFLTRKIRDSEEFKVDDLLHTETIVIDHMKILVDKISKLGEEIDSGLYSDSSETVQEIRHAVDQIEESYNKRVDQIKKYEFMF